MMLSIVIASWNTQALLFACLASIFQYPPPFAFEVIIVDNDSSDGSPDMVRAEFPGVRLIINHANLGFAAACNLGAGMASGYYLLFLNSDTLVQRGTLGGAVAYMEKHPGTGIMGCRTLNADGSLQGTALGFPTAARIFANVSGLSRFGKVYRLRHHLPRRDFDYIQGSFIVIAKNIFERCGRFDERFFLYGEDVDLCLRVRAAGLSIGYDPETAIIHHGSGSSKNTAPRLSHFIPGCIMLYRKYRKAPQVNLLTRFIKSALVMRFFTEAIFSILNIKGGKREPVVFFDLLAAVKKVDAI
jgi:GT2 family glycosyltransferase